MIKAILTTLDRIFPAQEIFAHCDIPCGIYDPHNSQVAAHTVLRMVKMINELKASSEEPDFDERKRIISQVSRLTKVKEDHAEIVKHEIRIIWGDHFKAEHLEKHTDLHSLVFEIMKLASKAKQEVSEEAANQLIGKVQEFSEIFWETKGVQTQRVKSNYPTEGETVLPKVA